MDFGGGVFFGAILFLRDNFLFDQPVLDILGVAPTWFTLFPVPVGIKLQPAIDGIGQGLRIPRVGWVEDVS